MRGKNKKNKAKDQSKDGANNRATKQNAQLKAFVAKAAPPVVTRFQPAAAGVASKTHAAKLERELAMRAAAAQTCSALKCPRLAADAAEGAGGAGAPVLSKCTGCAGHAAYCSTTCQASHWPDHKDFCKAKKAELVEIAKFEAMRARREAAEAERAAAELLRAEAGGGEEQEEEGEEEEDNEEGEEEALQQ
jgi:hypothetical protein